MPICFQEVYLEVLAFEWIIEWKKVDKLNFNQIKYHSYERGEK